ncbi:MAG: NADH-quinone oxidoreductase subunit C [Bacteroidetes bacterium 4572_114]|nr:MAG: NADH-quinone oxidoreductase subunit C [Bacteroidetes bacterium 4572_114]
MQEIKENLIAHIKARFPDATEKEFDGNRLDFTVDKQCVPSILTYLKDRLGYIHLSHITCVDWLEENEFELIFIVWSPVEKMKVFVRTRIDRNNPVMTNIDMIWRQANTYERELREMYGVEFIGLEAPDEFLLEDWAGPPPMRRDFDTGVYADETFWHRPGREDALDVREEIIKRSREEIPDFAKKYSR